MFDILFLGTGASVPSRSYALPCVAVRRGGDIILFDCGEGSQRQLMVSPFSFMKIRAIFVTHLHGDHFYGLPGLVQTMGMMGREEKLILRGPKGFSDALRISLSLCEGDIGFETDIADIAPGEVQDVCDLRVSVFRTEHGIESQGYVVREPDIRGKIDTKKARKMGIQGSDYSALEAGETVNGVTLADICSEPRRGSSVAYTGDTMRCQTVDEALKDVEVIIHESTYLEKDKKLAAEHFHSTAASAAETAKNCNARALFLIHVSNRYRDRSVIAEEARAIFPESYVPDDLAHFKIEKGGVRLA